MKKELDDLLCQRYPLTFAEHHLSKKQTCMHWGIACGDGWFGLIDTLYERLQVWTDHNKAPQVVAEQVKEKFGTQCFYPREVSQEQRRMIYMAEAMSADICDQRGKPGQALVHEFWHMMQCVEHAPEGAITQAAFIAQRKVSEGAP